MSQIIRARLAALLALLIMGVSPPTGPVNWSNTAQDLARYSSKMHDLGRFNGVVLVSHGGQVFKHAFGYANLAGREPNTVDTQFEIASLSKMFTAIAILKLRDRHELRLEESICKYLSPCPAIWMSISIDQVLHHRSGLPDYEDSLQIDSPQYYAFMTAPHPAQRIIEREAKLPLDFAPGSKFSYSNTGYVVLGFIVEKAAHRSYTSFLRSEIFAPAGMANTGVLGADPAPRLATGYGITPTWGQRLAGFKFEDAGAQPVPVLSLDPPEGDAGIFSTAPDLLRWAQIMMGAQPMLISASERTEIFHDVEGYGYGWMIQPSFGLPRYRHTGELPGFLSNIAIYPSVDTITVVLSNVDANMNAMTRDIQAIALGQPFDDPFSGALVTLTPNQQEALIGLYQLADGKNVCVAKGKQFLEAAIKNSFTAYLLPFAADRFYMPLASGQVSFTIKDGLRASVLNMRYNGEDHVATRIQGLNDGGAACT